MKRKDTKIKQLTKAEEEVMIGVWELGECTISQWIEYKYKEDKPPHSSVSTIFRVLEKKGFLSHVAYGRTYLYSPEVSKDEYQTGHLAKFKETYFKGSVKDMFSFFVKKEDLSLDEIVEIYKKLKL